MNTLSMHTKSELVQHTLRRQAGLKAAVTTPTALKVNARFNATALAQLHSLTASTGLGISEVLRLSVASLHGQLLGQKTPPASKIVAMAGKYSSAGDGTLSSSYKDHSADAIASKHSIRRVDH